MKDSNRIIPRIASPAAFFLGALAIWTAWLPVSASAEPTNGPLVALGLTNSPIGAETTLEIIENGILFVGNVVDDEGVSVHLGEADSGIFLYPLTGYVYGGDAMQGRAYGRVNGVADQLISSVHGSHNGDQSATVTVDFTPLGARHLSVFVGTRLLGRISNSIVSIWVQGDGYGCRANPWWRLPDGSFGALVELAQAGSWMSIPTVEGEEGVSGACVFIRPEDPTNAVQFVSRVDVTSHGLGSFCLTDARLGVFHQRHKALGQATLHAAGGQLTLGNFVSVSDIEDGVFVELPGVGAFNVDLLPIELTGTNSTLLIQGFGTSQGWAELGTVRIANGNGPVQISADISCAPQTEIQVRSGGALVGSITVSNNAATVTLSGSPRITGCALLTKTMETLPGIAVRVDRPTAFTASGGETLVGDEVRMLAPDPVFFESLESFVMLATDIPSFTITGESASATLAPELTIVRSTEGVILSWPDPNHRYYAEAAAAPAGDFVAVPGEPVFANNHCRMTVSSQGISHRFFRLRRHMPSSD